LVLAILVLTMIVFGLTRISGDPVVLMLPSDATEEQHEQMREELGLSQPLPVQYGIFILRIGKGDFGESFRWNQPVLKVVMQRFPATVQLALVSFAFAVLIGVPLGILATVYKGTLWEGLFKILAVFGQSIPTFWLGLMMILFFGVTLRILPAGGRGGPETIIMPALALAAFFVAALARLTRSSMLDALDAEYIKMARVKGVPESLVIWKHGFKNAAIPLITFAGMSLGTLLGGTVVTEMVFAWPGMGRLAVDSILSRDFPVVQSIVFLVGTIYFALNFLVDILYCYLDPRIRYG
jgi:peptide/nickel transport system permease protein